MKNLVQANSKITELEAKLTELQQELTVLQMQDKRTPIIWDDLYNFLGSDSEPTVRIDSLGIVACNPSPRDICKGIAWLAEESKPAYI